MFITIHAAFRSEDQVDFEGMGIKPVAQDFDDCSWDEITINPDFIVSMHTNSAGYTNMRLMDDNWTVKESPAEVETMVIERMGW